MFRLLDYLRVEKNRKLHLERAGDIDIGLLLDRTDHNTIKKVRNKFIVELSRILRKDIHLVILNSAGEELNKTDTPKGQVYPGIRSKKGVSI